MVIPSRLATSGIECPSWVILLNRSNFKLLGVSFAYHCWPPIALHCNQLECLLNWVRIIKNFIKLHDAFEDYPIHISVKRGQADLTQWLLEAGANSRAKNYWGNTASDIAEHNNNKDALSLLQCYLT